MNLNGNQCLYMVDWYLSSNWSWVLAGGYLSSEALPWPCYAKNWDAWSIVSRCLTFSYTSWCAHRDPLRWWCSSGDNLSRLNTPFLDVPQDQHFESPQLFLVLLCSFGLSVDAFNTSSISYISFHYSQHDQPGYNALLLFEKKICKKNSELGFWNDSSLLSYLRFDLLWENQFRSFIMDEVLPYVHAELTFVLQHWGLAGLLQQWEGLRILHIELTMVVGTKASVRTRRHPERRLIAKTRCLVRIAGAWSKAHIHWGLHRTNPGLEHCSVIWIEE